MKEWYLALLEPWRIAPHPNETARRLTPRAAFSLLVEGRLYDYNQYRTSEPTASLSRPHEHDLSSESRLVEAVFVQVAGGERTDDLRKIAVNSTAPLDLRLAAGVIASIALVNSGRIRTALEVLASLAAEAEREGDPDGAAIAHLHCGMRLAELGDWQRAIEATSHARSFIKGRTAAHRALSVLIDSNLWNYRMRTDADPGPLPGLEKRPLPHLLLRGAQLRSPALRVKLKRAFETRFDDPRARRFHWHAVDEVHQGLWASLMRDEITAHFGAVRRSRAMSAYYRLTSGTSIEEEDLREGLALLIRADEVQDTRSAGRFFVKRGPLHVLSETVHRVLEFDRSWLTAPATYALVEAAGEVIDPAIAPSVANELLEVAGNSKSATAHERVWEMLGHEPVEALASIVPVLPDDHHDSIAKHLLDLVDDEASFVFGDAVHRCILRLEWSSIGLNTRANWMTEALGWLESRDLRRLGSGVLVNLARAGTREARDRLVNTFRREPTLGGAASILDADIAVDSEVAQIIATAAARAIDTRQRKAAEGEHTWGSIDAALLLAIVLEDLNDPEDYWSMLIKFLVNPQVTQDEKERAFTYLANRVSRIPEHARLELLAHADDLQVSGRSFWGGDAPALGSQYALVAAVGGTSAERLLSDVLSWSQSSDVALRLEAAHLTQLAPELIPPDVVATTALALTYDEDVDVAGAAAWGVVQMLRELPRPLRNAASDRLRQMLQADGVVLPGSVLAGLRDKGSLTREFETDIEPLQTHLSVHLRRLARGFLL